MPYAVSQSAPSFYPDQEQEERDNLSPEEAEEIEKELHGEPIFDFDAFETPERVAESKLKLEAAIEVMPQMQKAAYLEALEKVPTLVEKETNLVMFLRCEHYNIQAAADRLVQHWKERKWLFGEERAFLPMKLSEGCAMDHEETHFELQQGFVTRHPDDIHGRPVVFLDRTNSIKSQYYRREAWLRVIWYIVQSIANEEHYQKTGFIVVVNLKNYVANNLDRIGAKKWFLYLRECFQVRYKGQHATYCSHQTPVKLVEPAIRQMQGRYIRLHVRRHYGYDSDNIQEMEEYGLEKRNLSTVVGGKQTHEDHLEWLKRQRQHDDDEMRRIVME